MLCCCCSVAVHVWLFVIPWSTPGFPVLHHLPELAQTHVHRVGDAIQPSLTLSFSFSSRLQSFPASGSFQMSQLFASGGQSIGASVSASVLPVNFQNLFPLRWTGLISLLSKGLSTVFSNTTVQKHQFFGTLPSLWSNSHSIHDYWKNHSLTIWTFVGKVISLLFNMLSRFVMAFLSKSKHVLISCLQTIEILQLIEDKPDSSVTM